jgi:hypothetical protein
MTRTALVCPRLRIDAETITVLLVLEADAVPVPEE